MRRTRKDHSGIPKGQLPAVPELEIVLYHWTPSKNRARIQKEGLCPNQKSLQGDWRPPYVCFSDEPNLAWWLSGRMYSEIEEWDLWMCRMDAQTSFDHYEIITDTYRSGRMYVKEYRVYTRVYKRDLIYVGSRTNRS